MPFVIPLVASLVLSMSAILYLAEMTPFEYDRLAANHQLIHVPAVMANLAIQVGALFLVDILGQALARRLRDRDVLTNELLEHLKDGVMVCDRDGGVLYSNGHVAELLGLGASRLERGQNIFSVLNEAGLDLIVTLLQTEGDQFLTLKLNEDQTLVCHRHPLIGNSRRIVGVVFTVSDETRLRRLEDQAYRSESLAEIGEVAASIAHEIRNPLASLRGCIQETVAMMIDERNDDAKMLGDIMVSEADRIALIVQDFLTMSRMRAPIWMN